MVSADFADSVPGSYLWFLFFFSHCDAGVKRCAEACGTTDAGREAENVFKKDVEI